MVKPSFRVQPLDRTADAVAQVRVLRGLVVVMAAVHIPSTEGEQTAGHLAWRSCGYSFAVRHLYRQMAEMRCSACGVSFMPIRLTRNRASTDAGARMTFRGG